MRARCLRLRVPERPEPGMLWWGRVRPGQDPVLRRADRHRYVLRRRSMRSRTKPAVRGVLLPHIDKSRQPSESSRPERSTRPGGARRRRNHRRRLEAASRSAQGPGIARRRHQFGSVPSSSRSSRIWRILGTRAGLGVPGFSGSRWCGHLDRRAVECVAGQAAAATTGIASTPMFVMMSVSSIVGEEMVYG